MSDFRYLHTAQILCHGKQMTVFWFTLGKITNHWMEIKVRMKSSFNVQANELIVDRN